MALSKTIMAMLYLALGLVLIGMVIVSIATGAVAIAPGQVVQIFLKQLGLIPQELVDPQLEAVMMAIRLPRVLLSILVGATLAVAGVALQGLFRNPMADPGLLGISSGASFFVAMTVVLQIKVLGFYTLPVAAFVGSMAAMILIYSLSQQDRKTHITTMLLAGIALNALFMSGTGLFTYLSTDEELRTITFWQMGSLSGASWPALAVTAPLMVCCMLGLPFLAQALNALLLGETNARYLGVSVERVKWIMIVLIAVGVGSAVSVSGMIGFVGLVVPHIVRLFLGPNHRRVLPSSLLVGAILLVGADLVARTVISPSELPIGIMTSLLGAPFFLYLILKQKKAIQL